MITLTEETRADQQQIAQLMNLYGGKIVCHPKDMSMRGERWQGGIWLEWDKQVPLDVIERTQKSVNEAFKGSGYLVFTAPMKFV